MLSNNELELRFKALKYYYSGQGLLTDEQLKVNTINFIDADEDAQRIELKKYATNKMIPEKKLKIQIKLDSIDNLNQEILDEQTELTWLENYIL